MILKTRSEMGQDRHLLDLGNAIAKLTLEQKSPIRCYVDELLIIEPDDVGENFPYSPPQNVRIGGSNIVALRDFLLTHYPLEKEADQ
jgi:hypothetical protein